MILPSKSITSLTGNQETNHSFYSCPVCNQNLDEVGDAVLQEQHVKQCLEGNSTGPATSRYLVYNLPAESALLGVECKPDEWVNSL